MVRMRPALLLAPLLLALLPLPVLAGEVEIVAAAAVRTGDAWRFDVTLRHADSGWEHYADAWEIRAPDGTVLGTRTLLHPHEDEQPFTRSLDGVRVPPGLAAVVVHARDTVHGWAPRPLLLPLE
jgi:hypothetical protein